VGFSLMVKIVSSIVLDGKRLVVAPSCPSFRHSAVTRPSRARVLALWTGGRPCGGLTDPVPNVGRTNVSISAKQTLQKLHEVAAPLISVIFLGLHLHGHQHNSVLAGSYFLIAFSTRRRAEKLARTWILHCWHVHPLAQGQL